MFLSPVILGNRFLSIYEKSNFTCSMQSMVFASDDRSSKIAEWGMQEDFYTKEKDEWLLGGHKLYFTNYHL